MSRRRRKGNKLIGRILLVSLVVHVIALPVLARFGAFDKIKREFVTSTVTVVPPPPAEKEKPVEKKAEAKKQVAKAKGPSQARSAQAHSNLSHPAVVASNAPAGGGGDEGPAIDPNGTGKAGVLPAPAAGGTGAGSGAGHGGAPSSAPPPQPEPKPTAPPPAPEPKPAAPPAPKPEPPAPKPHVPVLTEAEPSYQPQPTIPDDLRAEALDKTCVVEISVTPQGSASNVKISQSSGVDELDQLALDSAKKWRFNAATRDGEPVASVVRLHVQFKVE